MVEARASRFPCRPSQPMLGLYTALSFIVCLETAIFIEQEREMGERERVKERGDRKGRKREREEGMGAVRE